MGLALGHSWLVFQRQLTGGISTLDTVVSLVEGMIGVGLVWFGLKRQENQATWLGYMGAQFIWVGWFEWTWEYFSHWLKLAPVLDQGLPILSPALLMIQSTTLIVIFCCSCSGQTRTPAAGCFCGSIEICVCTPGN